MKLSLAIPLIPFASGPTFWHLVHGHIHQHAARYVPDECRTKYPQTYPSGLLPDIFCPTDESQLTTAIHNLPLQYMEVHSGMRLRRSSHL